MVRSEGETGDQGYHSRGRVVERTVVEECGCERALVVERDKVGGENGSTCSLASYARGPGQKVVGFSFYGNPNSTKGKERKYFQVSKLQVTLTMNIPSPFRALKKTWSCSRSIILAG